MAIDVSMRLAARSVWPCRRHLNYRAAPESSNLAAIAGRAALAHGGVGIDYPEAPARSRAAVDLTVVLRRRGRTRRLHWLGCWIGNLQPALGTWFSCSYS